MILLTIFHKCCWEDVSRLLMKHHPEYESSLPGFLKAFAEILTLEPLDVDMDIECTKGNEDGEEYISIDCHDNGRDIYLTLDSDWREIIAARVDERLFDSLTPAEIVSEALFEMTFSGYSYEEVLSGSFYDELMKLSRQTQDPDDADEEGPEQDAGDLDDADEDGQGPDAGDSDGETDEGEDND